MNTFNKRAGTPKKFTPIITPPDLTPPDIMATILRNQRVLMVAVSTILINSHQMGSHSANDQLRRAIFDTEQKFPWTK